jgi:transcriptional regulator EpsA
MLGENIELIQPDASDSSHGQIDQEWSSMSTALLDARELEALIVNIDASLNVHARPQFFSWTQGLLQSIVRHKALLCALHLGKSSAYRLDVFSTLVPDANMLNELLRKDPAMIPGLIKIWKQHNQLPVIGQARDLAAPLGPHLGRELHRIGATRLALHGIADAEGGAASLFVFACEPDSPSANEGYLLQVIVPFVHTAWVRSQPRESTRSENGAVLRSGVLTPREREILKWIYLGKSNAEVGAILAISPLTVKNHVQKILRKLKVVNRAQAVGKALDAGIIDT